MTEARGAWRGALRPRRQLLAPLLGTVWSARVAGVIVGSDRYVSGARGMDWRVLGMLPLVHGTGDDVMRSSAFDGVAIPAAGRVGWFVGTNRWSEGEFFRYRITDYRLCG